jgi:hypothetical protein
MATTLDSKTWAFALIRLDGFYQGKLLQVDTDAVLELAQQIQRVCEDFEAGLETAMKQRRA